MDEDSDSDQEFKQQNYRNQQATRDVYNPPFEATGFPMATEETGDSKTFNEVEALLKEMHSEDNLNEPSNIVEGNQTFQEDNSQVNPSNCASVECDQNQPPEMIQESPTSPSPCHPNEYEQNQEIEESPTSPSYYPDEYEPNRAPEMAEEFQANRSSSPIEYEQNESSEMLDESHMNRSDSPPIENERNEQHQAVQENEITSNYCRSKSPSPSSSVANERTNTIENDAVEGEDMELEDPTPPATNHSNIYEIIQQDNDYAISNPASVKNGYKNDDFHSKDSQDGIVDKRNRSKEVHKSYNGVRKDNKEELGRALEFIDRNVINMTFRVSDTEYKIDECNIVFSRVKTSTEEKEIEVATLKKDSITCFEDAVQKFMLDSLNSYRSRLMKELNSEREIEYVSVGSPAPSNSGRSLHKQQNPARSTKSETDPFSQVKLQELPKKLAKRIKYKTRAKASLSDSENGDAPIPTIPGMKTVPLKIPPSNDVAGYLFVSLKVHSDFLYYYPKVETLDQIVAATKNSPTSLAMALKASDAISNCSMFSSNSNLSTMSNLPLDRTTSDLKSSKVSERLGFRSSGDRYSAESKSDARRTSAARFNQSEENNEFRKTENHVCGCSCGKTVTVKLEKPEPVKAEELREVKTMSTLVDCDDCGVTFKNGANHKCSKRRGIKTEERLYTCEVCDRSFSKQAHLSNHMRSHKDYIKATVKCNLCNQRFRRKGEYAVHRAEHHPEQTKEYPCDECGETFKSSYRLNKHKRISHSTDSEPEMDVRCVNCNGMFNLTYYRTTHLNECSMTSPQNDNSRTDGSVQVTMRKPTARRSGPFYSNVEEESDVEYIDEYVLEEFEDRKPFFYANSEKSSVKSKGSGKKRRRFMNLDAPTSESETEGPPNKIYGVTSWRSSDGSEYIGQEELSLLDGGHDEEDYNGVKVQDFDMGEFIKHRK